MKEAGLIGLRCAVCVLLCAMAWLTSLCLAGALRRGDRLQALGDTIVIWCFLTTSLIALLLALNLCVLPVLFLAGGATCLAALRFIGLPQEAHRPGVPLSATAYGLLAAALLIACRDGTLRPTEVDTCAYHLPNAVEFLQSGSLWHTYPAHNQFYQFFPGNAYLLYLWFMLPMRSCTIAHILQPVYLLIVGVFCSLLVRQLSSAARCGSVAAVVVLALPVLHHYVFTTGRNDLLLAAFETAALYYLLRYARLRQACDALLCLACAGIAMGTKQSGLAFAAAAGFCLFCLACPRPARIRRPGARSALTLAAAVALCLLPGWIWLLRNTVLMGNPLYPLGLELGPYHLSGHFELHETSRTSLWTYLFFRPSRWFFEAWRDALLRQLGGALAIAVVAHSACLIGVFRWARRAQWDKVLFAVFLWLALIQYLRLPFSAEQTPGSLDIVAVQVRFALPGVILAAVWLDSALHSRGARALAVSLAVGTAALCVPLSATRDMAMGFAAGVLIFSLVRRGAALRRRSRKRAWVSWAAVCAPLFMLLALCDGYQRTDYGYSLDALPAHAALRYIEDENPRRIALLGTHFIYPFYGQDLQRQLRMDHRFAVDGLPTGPKSSADCFLDYLERGAVSHVVYVFEWYDKTSMPGLASISGSPLYRVAERGEKHLIFERRSRKNDAGRTGGSDR